MGGMKILAYVITQEQSPVWVDLLTVHFKMTKSVALIGRKAWVVFKRPIVTHVLGVSVF